MCFVGCKKPRQGEVDKFGSPEITYTIYGRSHLDYKDLFEKFTFEGRESYALANILAEEVDHGKLHYEGTLEQLYHGTYNPTPAADLNKMEGPRRLNEGTLLRARLLAEKQKRASLRG